MTFTKFILTFSVSLLIAACGGGGGSTTPTNDIKPSIISKEDATDVLSVAKSASLIEITKILDFSTYATAFLIGETDVNMQSRTYNAFNAMGGDGTVEVKKAKNNAGLSIGDSVKITFNNYIDLNSAAVSRLNGSIILTALSDTTIDISAANLGNAISSNYSLPFSVTFSPGFSQSKGASFVYYSGLINYNKFEVNSNYLKTMDIKADNFAVDILSAEGDSGKLTYSNLKANATQQVYDPFSPYRPVTISSSYTLIALDKSDGTSKSLNISNNITMDFGKIEPYDSAKYVITDFEAGKITATLSKPNVVIDIDEASNGSIDTNFSVLWSALD